METNEVDTTLDTIKQTTELLDMAWRVVEAAHHDILEGYTTLMGKVILAQDVGNLVDWIGSLDWHNGLALLVERVV